jgi:ABC-2 type transport system permease protein
MYHIIKFELSYRLRRPATYAYFLILFVLCFFFACTDSVTIGGATGNVFKNAPYPINQSVMIMTIFSTMIISAVMGVPVYRDFEFNFHEIMFTTPVKKSDYLIGRFLGSYLVCIFILSGIIWGLILGASVVEYMPWTNVVKKGPFMVMAYINPFVNFIVPNAFFLGVLFFVFGSLFRSQLAIYVQGVIVFVLYLIMINMQKDVDNNELLAIFDPFGFAASSYQTRYWTTAEKNSQLILLNGLLFYNRLFWISVALLLGSISYPFFKFNKAGLSFGKKKKTDNDSFTTPVATILPAVQFSYNTSTQFKQWLHLVAFEFKSVIRSVPFISIAFAGVLLLLSLNAAIGNFYGTAAIPVTYNILDLLNGNFMLFIIIIITFYTGELVWKEIGYRFSNISDSLPISRALLMTSKLAAMLAIVVMLLLVLMITGILLQTINGYTNYQIDVYLKQLFLIQFPYYVLLTLLCFCIHNLVNNKFIGHLLVILFYLGQTVLLSLDVRHNLIYYANAPSVIYSDMNGFGPFLQPVYYFYMYWGFMGIWLFMLGLMLMKHGSDLSIQARFKRMKTEWQKGSGKLIMPLSLLGFLICGAFIFYNTNVLNTYTTVKESKQKLADYEKRYRKYLDKPQPRIMAVAVNVDLYPELCRAHFKGAYTIKNLHNHAIQTVDVLIADETAVINNLSFETGSRLLNNDKRGYYIYALNKPLMPGDSTLMKFDIDYKQNGFTNNGGRTDIAANGTFLNNSMMPSLGYNEGAELSDVDDRIEQKLPKKNYRMRPVTDTASHANTYLTQDADWVRYQCTISTTADQIAISPGYLKKEWVQSGRKYFSYEMDAPILNFFSYLSARYSVSRDVWQNPNNTLQKVNIEIYSHPTHQWNVAGMKNAIKKTLNYASTHFSNYQFRQVRILEFPRYANFAQSFPNTIPFSEGLGFILDVDKETDIDMAFYVTAHEVAHQWWGHQVAGANCQGSTVMVETMAQYTALMVMEHEFGKAHMEKFLKYELDNYLRGRSGEQQKELPLMLCENQGYIHYNKGSCIMYALKDYIGETKVNTALQSFIKKYQYQQPPYVTAPVFVNYLRQATPDSLKHIITDMFEKITMFNLRTTAVSVIKNNNNYAITLNINATKAVADSIGNESKSNMNDWIDIGVYSKTTQGKDSLIYLQKHLISNSTKSISVAVNRLPSKAGIDPLHKLVDRQTSDNIKEITL